LGSDQTPLPDLSSGVHLSRLEVTGVEQDQFQDLVRLLLSCVPGVLKELEVQMLDLDVMALPLISTEISQRHCNAFTDSEAAHSVSMPVVVDSRTKASSLCEASWVLLDELLTSPRFHGIERVVLTSDKPLHGSTVYALARYLPQLHSLGLQGS
jgi:hypothetical protein